MKYPPVTDETKARVRAGTVTAAELLNLSYEQVQRMAVLAGVERPRRVMGGKDAVVARILRVLKGRVDDRHNKG